MRKLPKPTSQTQEVLYELINRISIDRRSMMLSCGVLNLTARISNLRYKGIAIKTTEIETINKFGREISYAQYSLHSKKDAIKAYMRMIQK